MAEMSAEEKAYRDAVMTPADYYEAKALAEQFKLCRDDGRCQYAIDHAAEGLGHCPEGKCVMKPQLVIDIDEIERCLRFFKLINEADLEHIKWTRSGAPIQTDAELLKEYRFMGLSNRDFPAVMGWFPDDVGIRTSVLVVNKKK